MFLLLIVMLFKSKQPPNASSSIFVTLLGIATLVKLVQANAPYPMLLTLPGIVTFVKLSQLKNAASSILVTPVSYTHLTLPTTF